MRCSEARGFNYDGSWGTSGLDLWQHHDHGLMAVEIARGKRYFPGWNLARWWLSQDAYQRNPDRFIANVEAGLGLFASQHIQVMPVLFNRWHDPVCDFGGVTLDDIIPGFSVFTDGGPMFGDVDHTAGPPGRPEALFRRYLDDVVGTFANDSRIFAWDLCNEPLMGPYVHDPDSPIRGGELTWLAWCAAVCRRLNASQPLTVGNWPSAVATALTEPISDIISFHAYDMYDNHADLVAVVEQCVQIARDKGKELIASETVWGAVDDANHVELMRRNLDLLAQHRVGFIVHALQHSLAADLHTADYGPVGPPGCMHFVNADGSLRDGHELWNEYAQKDSGHD